MPALRSDPRWTYAAEYCGHPEPDNRSRLRAGQRHVVRFCGEFVATCTTQAAALSRAVGEKARRDGALTVSEIAQEPQP